MNKKIDHRGFVININVDDIDILIKDIEYLKDGGTIQYVVDAYDVISYCYPFEKLYNVIPHKKLKDIEYIMDYVGDMRLAYSYIFQHKHSYLSTIEEKWSKIPILIKEHLRELDGFRIAKLIEFDSNEKEVNELLKYVQDNEASDIQEVSKNVIKASSFLYILWDLWQHPALKTLNETWDNHLRHLGMDFSTAPSQEKLIREFAQVRGKIGFISKPLNEYCSKHLLVAHKTENGQLIPRPFNEVERDYQLIESDFVVAAIINQINLTNQGSRFHLIASYPNKGPKFKAINSVLNRNNKDKTSNRRTAAHLFVLAICDPQFNQNTNVSDSGNDNIEFSRTNRHELIDYDNWISNLKEYRVYVDQVINNSKKDVYLKSDSIDWEKRKQNANISLKQNEPFFERLVALTDSISNMVKGEVGAIDRLSDFKIAVRKELNSYITEARSRLFNESAGRSKIPPNKYNQILRDKLVQAISRIAVYHNSLKETKPCLHIFKGTDFIRGRYHHLPIFCIIKSVNTPILELDEIWLRTIEYLVSKPTLEDERQLILELELWLARTSRSEVPNNVIAMLVICSVLSPSAIFSNAQNFSTKRRESIERSYYEETHKLQEIVRQIRKTHKFVYESRFHIMKSTLTEGDRLQSKREKQAYLDLLYISAWLSRRISEHEMDGSTQDDEKYEEAMLSTMDARAHINPERDPRFVHSEALIEYCRYMKKRGTAGQEVINGDEVNSRILRIKELIDSAINIYNVRRTEFILHSGDYGRHSNLSENEYNRTCNYNQRVAAIIIAIIDSLKNLKRYVACQQYINNISENYNDVNLLLKTYEEIKTLNMEVTNSDLYLNKLSDKDIEGNNKERAMEIKYTDALCEFVKQFENSRLKQCRETEDMANIEQPLMVMIREIALEKKHHHLYSKALYYLKDMEIILNILPIGSLRTRLEGELNVLINS
jgi:hypothetical protein